MSLAEIVQSSGWKNFMSKLYGIGASIVIVGALFKIQHYPGAGLFLAAGLITEAVIFFFSAFEPLHEEPDWSLVYPELAGIPDGMEGELPVHHGHRSTGHVSSGGGGGSAALQKFDEMLVNAEINQDTFNRLGEGLKKLNVTTANLNSMGDITAANNDYIKSVQGAAQTFSSHASNVGKTGEILNESINKLNTSYNNTAGIIDKAGSNYKNLADSLTTVQDGSKSYMTQLESLNKNLSALNAVYELQLKGANDHVKSSDAIAKDVQGLLKNLQDSAGDTQKYREQLSKLSENIGALNNVYGNMLSAMNASGK